MRICMKTFFMELEFDERKIFISFIQVVRINYDVNSSDYA